MTTTEVPVVLSGYGPVGREYAGLLTERAGSWAERYGVRLRLVAVRGRRDQTDVSGEVPPRARWVGTEDLAALLARTGAAAFAQAVPSDGAGTAADEALTALRCGAHLITATKSHLLTHWAALERTARGAGRAVRLSAATGAALPAGDLARAGLRGFDVRGVRGCLNGTATFVLDRLAEGTPLADAVAEAQRLGIAEADPGADLSGADAATKLRLLAALLWGWDPAAVEVVTEPITDALRGGAFRQVAAATREQPGVVRVELRAETGVLGALTGPEKAVRYDCGDAGEVTVSGGRSSPRAAALAMAKDTLAAALEGGAGPR
ncbi:homoserine dehydrogenase [Saccharopolyspora sp. CA-218241]|uniref:homoserine dehydrogenase n=1 Tax=Saccharopolyspora sp. CA-218241 TaxID=3240027 RepID=UPI003D9617F5